MGRIHVALGEEPIDAEWAIRFVKDENRGGVVLFLGDVRRTTDDVETGHLEYEAYEDMALKVMHEIGMSAAAEFEANVAIIHRLGTVMAGETSVVCAAACAHRAEAFDCCRKLIDRIKTEAPIWKKEFGPDGAAWVS